MTYITVHQWRAVHGIPRQHLGSLVAYQRADKSRYDLKISIVPLSSNIAPQRLWPTAVRLRNLLEGAKVRLDQSVYTIDPTQSGSRKRNVDDALGSSKNPDLSARDRYSMPVIDNYSSSPATSIAGPAWDYAHNARMVAHTLGIDSLSTEASASSYPGYQWWPSQLLTTEGLTHLALSAPTDIPPVNAPMAFDVIQGYTHPPQQIPHSDPRHHQQTRAPSQEPFTFGQGNPSQSFDPEVDYGGYNNFSRYQQSRDQR